MDINTLKIVTADKQEFEAMEVRIPNAHVVTVFPDIMSFYNMFMGLANANLDTIEVKKRDETLATFINQKLEGTQTTINPDGSITGYFYFGARYADVDFSVNTEE
ncbi:MAG: hypothetical protein J6N19_04890 [Clostridium sp.]|nr:hypothetical protein [Clostridium sp.]